MVVGGTTVMPERLFCGRRVLSQRPPSTGRALHGGQMTIKILLLLTDVANNSSARLGATEGSQNQEVLAAKTTAPCNNRGDNAYVALGMKQLRVLC
jgi:hypothetical protein